MRSKESRPGFPLGLSCSRDYKGHIALGDRAQAQTSAQGLPQLLLSPGPPSPAQFSREKHCYEVATTQNRSLSRAGAGRGERRQGGAGEGRAGPGHGLFHCSPGLGAVVVPASLEGMTGLLGTCGLMASSGARSSLVLPGILATLLPCLWGLSPGPPAQCAHLPCLLPWLVKLRVGLATHMSFPGFLLSPTSLILYGASRFTQLFTFLAHSFCQPCACTGVQSLENNMLLREPAI